MLSDTEKINKYLREHCQSLINLALHWERWRACQEDKPSIKRAEKVIARAHRYLKPIQLIPVRFDVYDIPDRLRFVMESLDPESQQYMTLSECIRDFNKAMEKPNE